MLQGPVQDFPKARSLFLSSQVDQKSCEEITKHIILINDHDEYLRKVHAVNNTVYNPEPIKVYIDSYGGVVYQILGLISVIEKSVTPVHTIVTGCAISCGFVLLVSGHKRFAYKHSTMMYHQVSATKGGKMLDLEESLEETKRIQQKIEDITLEKTKISKTKLHSFYNKKKDWYITAQEAIKLKVIDEIL